METSVCWISLNVIGHVYMTSKMTSKFSRSHEYSLAVSTIKLSYYSLALIKNLQIQPCYQRIWIPLVLVSFFGTYSFGDKWGENDTYDRRSGGNRILWLHQVICATDRLHSVLSDLRLDPSLTSLIKFHKYHIGYIADNEDECLPPVYFFVYEEADETDEAHAVEGDVSE